MQAEIRLAVPGVASTPVPQWQQYCFSSELHPFLAPKPAAPEAEEEAEEGGEGGNSRGVSRSEQRYLSGEISVAISWAEGHSPGTGGSSRGRTASLRGEAARPMGALSGGSLDVSRVRRHVQLEGLDPNAPQAPAPAPAPAPHTTPHHAHRSPPTHTTHTDTPHTHHAHRTHTPHAPHTPHRTPRDCVHLCTGRGADLAVGAGRAWRRGRGLPPQPSGAGAPVALQLAPLVDGTDPAPRAAPQAASRVAAAARGRAGGASARRRDPVGHAYATQGSNPRLADL